MSRKNAAFLLEINLQDIGACISNHEPQISLGCNYPSMPYLHSSYLSTDPGLRDQAPARTEKDVCEPPPVPKKTKAQFLYYLQNFP